MSRIDDLIEQLCPDGVLYKPIKKVYRRLKGTPITAGKMKEIADPDGEIKIFAGGQTMILAHEKDIPRANITRVPAVLVQSRGIIDFVYYDQPFTFKNEMWAYTADDNTSVKFLYHVLKANAEAFRNAASGMGSMPQISLKVTEDFKVPIPPMEIQQEIVRVLDSFTELEAELEAELKARKCQYSHYRDELLDFSGRDDVQWLPLGSVSAVYDGTHQTPKYVSEGIRFVSVENINAPYASEKYITQEAFDKYKIKPSKGDVLMTRIGTIGLCSVLDRDEDLAYYVSLALVRPDTEYVLPRYLKHIIESSIGRRELRKRTLVNAVPIKVNLGDVGKIEIPVPQIEEQERIVAILDKFNTLVNDIYQGLPAEIEARRKQYAYYRDKLLAFKEKIA